jgi:hypothetical protein
MRLAPLVSLLTLLAGPALAQDTTGVKPKLRRLPNLISVEEIESIREVVPTAYDVVQRLRPQYLRSRGATSFGNAAGGRTTPYARIVVDGVPQGDLSVLRQISAMVVKEIEYLDSKDASIRWGTGYDGGAILVRTR